MSELAYKRTNVDGKGSGRTNHQRIFTLKEIKQGVNCHTKERTFTKKRTKRA